MQSTQHNEPPLHLGIIMDGNGRWARQRGLTRAAGHRRGADAVRRTVETAPELGIDVLTLYAFSSDNWGRPTAEVNALMFLLEKFLRQERHKLASNGVRLNVIGRRQRLRGSILEAIEDAEATTRGGTSLLLRVAIDYSARNAILDAAELQARPGVEAQTDFSRRLEEATHSVAGVPPVDLIVRTSGEQRLSDFLLWESAYAELAFVPVLWPDFRPEHLRATVDDFLERDRRFGRRPALAS